MELELSIEDLLNKRRLDLIGSNLKHRGIRMIFIIAFVHLPMILTMLVADMF